MNSMPDSGRPHWVVLALVVGTLVCGASVAGVLAVSDVTQDRSQVGTGQQLATVITVTDEEVRHEVGVSAIDAAAERGDEAALAAALADRAAVLTDRSGTIAAEFANATAAYENGTLSEQGFAWRLALLNARAGAVRDGIDHVASRAEAVPQPALDEAGYDADALTEARAALDPLTGRGLAALLAQYTGESAGSFSVDAGDGLSVEVESADGERSREFERERPGNGRVTIDGLAALAAARDALSGTDEGAWYPTELELDRDEGVYELAFEYWSDTHVGEAEVAVDGATGEVFSLEEAREPHDGSESVLGIDVREGSLEPGGAATLVVTLDGEPVEGATVLVNDEPQGRTDTNGTLSLSLPRDDDVEIAAEYLDADAELELALGSPDDDRERDDDDSEDDGEGEDERDDEEDEQQEDGNDEDEGGDEREDEQDEDEDDEDDDEQEGEQQEDDEDEAEGGDEPDDGEEQNEEDDEDEDDEDEDDENEEEADDETEEDDEAEEDSENEEGDEDEDDENEEEADDEENEQQDEVNG